LSIIAETASNISQNILLLAFKSYTGECMDSKEVWGEEGKIVVISLT
jgi:hypothetical protein